jgi:Spy/CpxP family protein refolding chaperone
MKVCQTIRGLVVARARALAVGAGICLLAAVPAMGQARGQEGPGGRPGGLRVHSFMSPTPPPPPPPVAVRPPHVGLQLGLGGRWWDEDKTIKKLKLRTDQQRRMDEIFASNKPALQTLYDNLEREQTRLASLPPGDLQDESKVFAAIDRVAQARTDLEKARVHLVLQLRQQMDADQLSMLDKEIANAASH